MSSRRQVLKHLEKGHSTHAGLWLDKYIRSQDRDDTESHQKLVRETAEIRVPEEYSHCFERWRNSLTVLGARYRTAETMGRISVGLGGESVLETSISLHRTYGVPYIPGSAIKGLASRFVRQHLEDDWQDEPYNIMFGSLENAGHVIFFDALPFPGSVRLNEDIITVHHDNYYRGEPDAAPTDFDSPNPIPFLSASGRFLIALAGPKIWTQAVFEILEEALNFSGVGAKTSSGYGRMQLSSAPPVDPEQVKVDALIAEIRALKKQDVAGSINAMYEKWSSMDLSKELKCEAAEAIIEKVKEAGREKKSSKKSWFQELISFIEEHKKS